MKTEEEIREHLSRLMIILSNASRNEVELISGEVIGLSWVLDL